MPEWFPHDATAGTDAKLMQLRAKSGGRYYGNYWLTLEWLWQMADAKADLGELDGLAFYLHESEKDTRTFINFCTSIGLFIEDGECFYSQRLLQEKGRQIEKSEIARANVAKRKDRQNNKRSTGVKQSYNGRPTQPTNQPTNKEGGAKIAPTPKKQNEQFFSSSDMQTTCIEYLVQNEKCSREVAKKEIDAFVNYWTEPNPTGKKMRWQMQKTFDVKRRLTTWLNNAKDFSSKNSRSVPVFS